MKTILVTGGGGYIGSHLCSVLLIAGYRVVVIDTFEAARRDIVKRIWHAVKSSTLARHKVLGTLHVIKSDVRECNRVQLALHNYRVDYIVHSAGLNPHDQYREAPHEYYACHIGGACAIVHAAAARRVKNVVLCVVGEHGTFDSVNSPYNRSIDASIGVFRDTCDANPQLQCTVVRCPVPVGCDTSGVLGQYHSKFSGLFSRVVRQKLYKRRLSTPTSNNSDEKNIIQRYVHVTRIASRILELIKDLSNTRPGFVDIELEGPYYEWSKEQIMDVDRARDTSNITHLGHNVGTDLEQVWSEVWNAVEYDLRFTESDL